MLIRFLLLGISLSSTLALTGPVDSMNTAFDSLSELLPFIAGDEDFEAKANEKKINENLMRLGTTFKNLKHEKMLKNDLFAPSYQVINDHLAGTIMAFAKGNKNYAQWRLKELTSLCLDCHSRIPEEHASHYQTGKLQLDKNKFKTPYNLGIAQLIVRQYPEAIWTFTKVVDDSVITQDYRHIEKSLKQLLLIRVKIMAEYESMLKTVQHYRKQKNFPDEVKDELKAWERRLTIVKDLKLLKRPPRADDDIKKIIQEILQPILKKGNLMLDNYDVDLLATSGVLSRYLFDHQTTELAPEIIYWLGWSEKFLHRESFFGPGDLLLKRCVRRYPAHPVAKECFAEFKENVEFEFTGSAGTNIPDDVKKEVDELSELIRKNQK